MHFLPLIMHRLISDGELVILGMMGNAGLPEQGEVTRRRIVGLSRPSEGDSEVRMNRRDNEMGLGMCGVSRPVLSLERL